MGTKNHPLIPFSTIFDTPGCYKTHLLNKKVSNLALEMWFWSVFFCHFLITSNAIVGYQDLIDDPFSSTLIYKLFGCCNGAAQGLGLVVTGLKFGQRHGGSQGSSLWSRRRLRQIAIAIIVDTRHDVDFQLS